MPKKRCCCDVEPEPEDYGNCCRPIASHCVGKSYRFTYKFKAKYPCLTVFYDDVRYRCPNGVSVDVLGEPEEWVLNIEYTINNTAKVRGRYGPKQDGFGVSQSRLNWVDPTGSSCPFGISDAKEGPYADCRSDVDLTRCYPFGRNTGAIPWPPVNSLGIRFNGCYDSYSIKDPYETCQTNGITNLINVSSYSFQFVPSTIQQQTNYQPKLTPNLLKFELACQNFPNFLPTLQDGGYDINLDIGIGLNRIANCGQGVDIPIVITYSETIDDFFGQPVFNGIYITSKFNREIIGADRMDICLPKTTKLYPTTDSWNGTICTRNTNIKFKDSYRMIILEFYFGSPYSFGIPNSPIQCEVSLEPSVLGSWPDICTNFGFDYEIDVVEV